MSGIYGYLQLYYPWRAVLHCPLYSELASFYSGISANVTSDTNDDDVKGPLICLMRPAARISKWNKTSNDVSESSSSRKYHHHHHHQQQRYQAEAACPMPFLNLNLRQRLLRRQHRQYRLHPILSYETRPILRPLLLQPRKKSWNNIIRHHHLLPDTVTNAKYLRLLTHLPKALARLTQITSYLIQKLQLQLC